MEDDASTDAGAGSMGSLLRRVAAAPSVEIDAGLEAGARVGDRYRVVEKIGVGGMGEVYRARDTRLDRDVALKLHRGTVGERALGLLRGEARAMAQLSHPNVVAVFEVGRHEDGVFIAMEYIAGGTLRQWLAEPGRGWREVVDLLLDAGGGLAAAHAAGLIHRDFKPENVLIGHDGRPRVADFGLAFHTSASRTPTADDNDTEPGDSVEISASTRVGTPAYMAPEQVRGTGVDERADQFAFCVTVHEAVFGTLQRTPSGAAVVEPSRSGAAAVAHVLRRGLSPAREDRYPTLAALLGDLNRARTRRRRTAALFAGGAALAIATATAVWLRDDPQARCARVVRTRVAAVEADVAAAAVALEDTDAEPARERWTRLASDVQRYVDQWREARLEACRAATPDGAATRPTVAADATRDAGARCLDGAAGRLRAHLAVIADEPGGIGERTLVLPSIAPCRNPEYLARREPAPPDAAVAAEVARVRETLAEVEALHWAGRYEDSLALGRTAATQAEATAYGPIDGRAQLWVAFSLEDLGRLEEARDAFVATFHRASAVGDHDTAFEASSSLMVVLADLGDLTEAQSWVGHAQSQLERLGRPTSERIMMLSALANLREDQSQYDESVELLRELLTLLPPEGDHVRRAKAHNSLGAALYGLGRADEAIAEFRSALQLYEAYRGPDHPDNAYPMANLAFLLSDRDDLDEADLLLRRTLPLLAADDAQGRATVLGHLGGVASRRGQRERAIAAYGEAIEIAERGLGPDHVVVGQQLSNLAGELNASGEPERAAALYQRALTTLEGSLGPDHRDLTDVLSSLAGVLIEAGQPKQALEHATRALVILQARRQSDGGVHVITPLTMTGLAHYALGKLRQARGAFERALEAAEAETVAPATRAEAQFGLAKVLWAQGRRERAVRAARAARDNLGAPADADALEQVRAWLAVR